VLLWQLPMIMTMMTTSYLLLGSEVVAVALADLHHATIIIIIITCMIDI
jgi:hypothetical protein